MPDVSAHKFVQLFQGALSKGGRLGAKDVSALKRAQQSIRGQAERAAAEQLLALVRNDRELDDFEVAPTRKALGVLLGVNPRGLPKDLEAVLANAVPQANARVKHYELNFDLTGNGPSFKANAKIHLEKAAGKQTVLEVNPERLTISSVKAGGKEVSFSQKDGRLFVSCPKATTLEIAYSVRPADSKGPSAEAFGLIRNKYTGRMWTLTWPYNTGALFPSNSDPSDGSTSKVTVKVSSGVLTQATGTRRGSSFELSAEAPAYAIGLYAAKDFELGNAGTSRDGVEIRGLGLGNQIAKANREAYREAARKSLDFYSEWLGRYEFGDSLHLVEVAGDLGGMEHASAVAIMSGSAKDLDYGVYVAAHEVAHHWFGDNVRIKHWGDFWMSEGFTDYASFRYLRHDAGDERFFSLLDEAKGEIRDLLAENPHALSASKETDVGEIFDAVPYKQGAWMLRMLEAQLGTKVFDSLLRNWFTSHRQKAVSTEDFVRFAKKELGRDLGPFFKAWGNLKEVPTFKADVKLRGKTAQVSLSSKAPVPAGIEIPVRLEGTGGQSKTVKVAPGKTVSLDAGFPIKRVRWDPDRTVLAYVR